MSDYLLASTSPKLSKFDITLVNKKDSIGCKNYEQLKKSSRDVRYNNRNYFGR